MRASSGPAAGRPRYGRLARLPGVRATGRAAAATVLGAVAAAAGRRWAPLGLAAGGALATTVYLRRHRHRIALERHMVLSLLGSGRGARRAAVAGLGAEVAAETTGHGVTRVRAATWLDAVRAAGFVMARDRGFQMELMRRTASGRLAEVWGRPAVGSDELYRAAGLAGAAARATALLEPPERELLAAFTEGVNAAFDALGPPFECRFLSYRPAAWTPTDSVLLALFMFHALSGDPTRQRADAVIRHSFPAEVASFFLPGGGPGGADGVPAELARFRAAADPGAGVVSADRPVAGSNCWVLGTPAGPLLACDLHLPLAIPNVLYELDLAWPGGRVRGFAVAGLPIVLAGTNGHIVWGVTDLTADVLELTEAGTPRPRRKTLTVRGGEAREITFERDGEAPVAPEPLLGRRVAVHWSGHDPRSADLKLSRLAHVTSVAAGLAVVDGAGGIPLNLLVADGDGHMAHVASGLLPRRPADAEEEPAGGFLGAAERPRRVDPPEQMLVSANDAALASGAVRIHYDPDPGYRAERIRTVLTGLANRGGAGPAEMRALQHDTVAGCYEPYRELAVAALDGGDPELRRLLAGWDGTAATDSRAFPVLVRLRSLLAERVLTPFLAACRDHDPAFVYAPNSIDRPLLAILRSGDPALLPPGEEAGGWPGFLARSVTAAAREVRDAAGGRLPPWGALNSVGLAHPLSRLAPWAAGLLGIAPLPQPGALHCVRTCVPGFGAVGRAVLSPGAGGAAWFDLPAGQSGHPLSPHYADRHGRWASTSAAPPERETVTCTFVLHPPSSQPHRATARRSAWMTRATARRSAT